MKLNIGDKVMVKARGDEGRHWNLGVDTEYCDATIEGEVCHTNCWDCDVVLVAGPHHRQYVPASAIKPIKKPFQLKDGKKYETADGLVFKVRKHPEYENIWDINDEALEHWDESGVGFLANPDLIRRHYTKPQPAHKLDLQEGDVVELCGWEDNAHSAVGDKFTVGKKGIKSGMYNFKQPKGERPLFKVLSRAT